jgi:hypothetical protein
MADELEESSPPAVSVSRDPMPQREIQQQQKKASEK